MFTVTLRFYEELNDFLDSARKKRDFEFSFQGRRSVKDLIESLGVPHVEVDLILVNGESVDFSYIIKNGDRISVYPIFETLSISGVSRLRSVPLRDPRFVLDVHLRKLARRLRLLGFDVDYNKSRDDDELAAISSKDKRILLSRDKQLMMRRIITHGLYVRNTDPEKQVIEVLERLNLWELCNPFSRCIECNSAVEKVNTGSGKFEKIVKLIPEGVLSWCDEFFHCTECGRIYWKGSHYDKLEGIVKKIMREGKCLKKNS